MHRPDKPRLTGIHRSPSNRFEWDFSYIPSPQRASTVLVPADLETGGRHTQEAIPVICDWCGMPWWPHWSVKKGCCSEECSQSLQAYLQDRRTKAEVMTQLQSETVSAKDLEGLLKELQARLAEEEAENARLRGELGKAITI